MLNEKTCKHLELALRASKEREVELKVKATSMQEAIDDESKKVIELKRKVIKLQQEKEQDVSAMRNLSAQVKD